MSENMNTNTAAIVTVTADADVTGAARPAARIRVRLGFYGASRTPLIDRDERVAAVVARLGALFAEIAPRVVTLCSRRTLGAAHPWGGELSAEEVVELDAIERRYDALRSAIRRHSATWAA